MGGRHSQAGTSLPGQLAILCTPRATSTSPLNGTSTDLAASSAGPSHGTLSHPHNLAAAAQQQGQGKDCAGWASATRGRARTTCSVAHSRTPGMMRPRPPFCFGSKTRAPLAACSCPLDPGGLGRAGVAGVGVPALGQATSLRTRPAAGEEGGVTQLIGRARHLVTRADKPKAGADGHGAFSLSAHARTLARTQPIISHEP
ncbi:hypothetical protein ACCO45_001738 [Purpureocillium lilacinum]|uniref:Uncharacterized protein n=1 Tax=Purpureocillium lilacinum TaxID=33203 RepID=A0ACC4E9A1_PURLI